MPELGPDICYSCQELLTLVAREDLHLSHFADGRQEILSIRADVILETCQSCNWIAFDKNGRIILTGIGKEITQALEGGDSPSALRTQIASMIRTYNWPWTQALRYGREEVLKGIPDDAKQCLDDANALKRNWPRSLIRWWHELYRHHRGVRAEENSEVGLRAEELSYEYEYARTGVRPDWRGLETSFDGYDILSRVSKKDRTALRVEVKGTSVKPSSAEFSVTRNEWRTARSGNYVLHLWSLENRNILTVVDFANVDPHSPLDRNKGRWDSFQVRFGLFFSDASQLIEFTPSRKLRTPFPRRLRKTRTPDVVD